MGFPVVRYPVPGQPLHPEKVVRRGDPGSMERCMVAKLCSFFLVLTLLAGISGCYINPVRHLASDAALLKVGESTKEDVLVFLGEPDEQQESARVWKNGCIGTRR